MNAPLPKAYKEGYADFYGRNFLVTPAVLIPRPETEAIIDIVKSLAGKPILPGVKAPTPTIAENAKILDVGTGSGCIAVTLKKELPSAQVTGVDIDRSALEIAEKNAKNHEAKVTFAKSDLLADVKETPDVLVANLPYVDKDWDWLDKAALSYEPAIALYADDHGLELIKRLIAQATERKIAHIILEADTYEHQTIQEVIPDGYELAKTSGFILYIRRMSRWLQSHCRRASQ